MDIRNVEMSSYFQDQGDDDEVLMKRVTNINLEILTEEHVRPEDVLFSVLQRLRNNA
jgi:hypothetical protein